MANVLAVDGPAGAGCTSLSKSIEREFGIPKIPTSLCYRGLSVALLRELGDPNTLEPEKVADYISRNIGRFVLSTDAILFNDEDITAECRVDPHHEGSSAVSKIPEVRQKFTEPLVAELVRSFNTDLVVSEGRDEYYLWRDRLGGLAFGTYLTAAAEIRARRWIINADNVGQMTGQAQTDYHNALISILKRDTNDSSRPLSPMTPAHDALLVTDGTTDDELADCVTKQGQMLIDSGHRAKEEVFTIVASGITTWRSARGN